MDEAVTAFDRFFRENFPKAVAVAERVTGERSSAEDAALEALAKAHFRWRRVGAYERPDLWVLKVAANEAIRRLPKLSPTAEPPVTVNDPADAVTLRETLTAALAALPSRQREAIVLRYLVGLSEPEVAAALNVSLGTVKTHLRRGMHSLRDSRALSLKETHLARLA